ncbi:MAG: PAS domain S-box protein [Methylococcaceae bacterium]|nr:PAS domain S-box protein [Methylococcaceae bacterium]
MHLISSFKTYRFLLFTITIGYLVALAALGYVGAQINQTITELGTQTGELYSHPFQVNAAAREARLAVSRIRNELLYAIADHSKIHSDIVEHISAFDDTLDRSLLTIEANFLGDITQVRTARDLTQSWRSERTQLIALLIEGPRADAEEFMMTRTAPIYEALISKLDYVVDFSAQKAKYFAEQAEQKSASSLVHFQSLLLALTLIVMAAGGVTVVVVLRALRRRDQQLAKQHNATRRFEAIVKSTDDAIISKTLDGIIESWNDGAEKIFGYSAQEAIGHPMQMLIPPDRYNEEPEILAKLARGERVDHFETVRCRKDGSLINISATISPIIDDAGKVIGASKIARDFTEHHRTELELRIAAAAFEAQEGIVVTNPQDVVMRVNQAFTKITGYQAEEAIGSKMNFLKSGRHDESFYNAMWQQLVRTCEWQGEIWNRCKNGEIHPHWVTITSVRDSKENVINYVGTYMDITDRKRIEDEIRQLAYHDPLTRLPNRRLLNDRLQQVMVASVRSQNYAALMFLDLDNFKPLNDIYGHDAGDLLLLEVTNRLKSCVREMDTVARFGGDEFVVMVSELDTDKANSTAQAQSIADKIRAALSAPYHLDIKLDHTVSVIEHHCTASIGVTVFIGKQDAQDD